MPEGTRVAKCVEKLMAKGYDKANAIRMCQKTTKQAYMTGKRPKSGPNAKKPKKKGS
jgi:hypothetical protein